MKNHPLLLAFIFSIFFFSLNAQLNPLLEEETEKKMTQDERKRFHEADQLISGRRYLEAAFVLDTLYKEYPDDEYVCFVTGLCLSYDPDRAAQALMLIKNAYGINTKISDYDYHLAYAYEQCDKFDDAIKYYQLFLNNKKLPAEVREDAKHRLDYCKSSRDLSGKYEMVKISNIGKPVNTTASEYVPCLPSDESFIVYTYLGELSKGGKQALSKAPKKDGKPADAIFFEDVFISKKDINGNWLPPHGIEAINTINHDACVSISHDGSKLYFFRNIGAGKGDIYQSTKLGENWSKPEPMKGINSLEWEGSLCLFPDEKHVVFSSERKDGRGGRDLWLAELLADGTWGNIKNFGEKINSKYDEDSPFITADGMTLFFSSNNSQSIGGYDIFRSDKVAGEWSKPYNIGKPVNTPQDDRFYVLSADGKRGYYSSGKAGGFGLQDIYVVEPGMIGKPVALVQIVGKVTCDSLPAEAKIAVRSKLTKKEVFAEISSNASTGSFLVNLPAGNDYEVVFKPSKFEEQVKEVNTTFIDSFIQIEVFADFYSPKAKEIVKIDPAEVKSDYEAENFNFDDFVREYGNAAGDSIEFKVQVGAYRFIENFNYTNLIGLPKIIRKTYDDGITRFIMGSFKTFNEATPLLILAKRKIDKGCFIIAVRNGHRMKLTELVKSGLLKK